MIKPSLEPDERLAAAGKRPGVGSLVHDLISLFELQAQLFLKDLGELKSGAVLPIAMLIGGIIIAFACAPVVLLTLGWCLAEISGIPLWAAMAVSVVLGGVVPAAILTIVGWSRLKQQSVVLQRSTAELKANSRWIKHRIKSSF